MHAMAGVFVLFVMAAVPAAKVPEIAIQVDRGVNALRAGSTAEAEKVLAQAVDAARQAGDGVSEARALFYLGLVKQQQAMAMPDEKAAAPLYEKARECYVRSAEKYPDSTATLSNLAEVEEALGDRVAAKRTLERGYQIGGARRDYFAVRLAEIRAAEGKIDEALALFNAIDRSGAAAAGIEKKLIDAFLASSRPEEEFISFLWTILPSASADDVLLGAFAAFRKGDMDREEIDALFGVVAATWAKQNYSLQQLAELGVLKDFIALKQKEPYRERAESLDALLHSNFSKRDLFFRWPAKLDDNFPSDLSPRSALADFSASLGRRFVADRMLDRAEGHFALARELGRHADLQLADDLASVYFSQRRLLDLQKLTREMDAVLYANGGTASNADLAQLYGFHRALGTYHALLEPPPSINPTPSAAADQLQKAINAAELLSKKRVAEGKPPFEIDPVVLRLLARSKANHSAAARD